MLQEHQLPVCTADDEPVRQEQCNRYDEKNSHGWFNQRLNFINSAVKPFFHCQHLIVGATHAEIKMASFMMKNAI
jgi:hypothetical protein